jgi:multiple sugar transport system permease protein
MMTDTSKGRVEALGVALGVGDFTWVTDPWLGRIAVVIGDTWQWTPFVFIVLLAALESLDQEVREAALVDGASRSQSFLHITVPALLPVTTTIVLIRIIEGFKIIDMPNILLGGDRARPPSRCRSRPTSTGTRLTSAGRPRSPTSCSSS